MSRRDGPAEEGTLNNQGAAPSNGAPIPTNLFAKDRLSLAPQLVLIEVAASVPNTEDALSLRIPALGAIAMYSFSKRIALFAALYGTSIGGDFEAGAFSGSIKYTIVAGGLGVAVAVLGSEPEDTLRLTAAGILFGFTTKATLDSGRAEGRSINNVHLFTLNGAAAAVALQLEWHVWDYVAIVPYATGWRHLVTSVELGSARASAASDEPWHVSPGLDIWIYLFPPSTSHISLGALLGATADKPTSTFTIGYTFVWDDVFGLN